MLNLNPQSLFVGQSVIYVQEIESTNAYLKTIVKEGDLAEGTVVVTDNQTAGRGQRENVWVSNANDNGLFSVLLQPINLKPEQLSVVSFLVSLAVRACVQKHIPTKEVKVKWPNDILVGDRKISGILIENLIGVPMNSVIGIGLNVNQKEFGDLSIATSLTLESGKTFEVGDIISDCLTFVEKYYLLTKRDGGLKQIWNLYVSQLYKHNETVKVDGEPYTVMGVKKTGELIVSNNTEERVLQHKEAVIQWN